METINKIIIVMLVAILVVGIGLYVKKESNFGSLFVNENVYSSASYATTSIPSLVATSLLSRATSTRTMAKICYVSDVDEGIVWLYKQATSTGVVINRGTPIFSTTTSNYSSYDICVTYDSSDPYIGEVWGISDATSTISVESVQE